MIIALHILKVFRIVKITRLSGPADADCPVLVIVVEDVKNEQK